MGPDTRRNFAFDTIESLEKTTSLLEVGTAFAAAMTQLGFNGVGINALPPPEPDANPLVMTEILPEGFRDLYAYERLYLINHITDHARVANSPFRYSEAPYSAAQARAQRRFMQVLRSHGLGAGLIIPVACPGHLPGCVWLAGDAPNLHDDAIKVIHLIGLFMASKAQALLQSVADPKPADALLTAREREVLTWAAQGKSSWEIGAILRIAKRTVDEHTQRAAHKLGAANKTQAVAIALVRRLIEI